MWSAHINFPGAVELWLVVQLTEMRLDGRGVGPHPCETCGLQWRSPLARLALSFCQLLSPVGRRDAEEATFLSRALGSSSIRQMQMQMPLL